MHKLSSSTAFLSIRQHGKFKCIWPVFPQVGYRDYKLWCFLPIPSKTHSGVLCQLAKFGTKSLILKQRKNNTPRSLYPSGSWTDQEHANTASCSHQLAWGCPYTHHDIAPQAEPRISAGLLTGWKYRVQDAAKLSGWPTTKIHATSTLHFKCQPLSQRKTA